MGRKRKAMVVGSEADGMDKDGGTIDAAGGSSAKEKSLYEFLCVERTASKQEIKKAYHKLALQLHPDKNPGDEESKEKFQFLQKVIGVLGDDEKRAIYDETGCAEDLDLVGEAANNFQEFFRDLYKRVTVADIEEFEANYRGSDSEKKDLKDLYLKFNGNMGRLFNSMICSDPKLDSHRFKDILDDAITEGELKATKPFQKWAKMVSSTKCPTDAQSRGKSKKGAQTDLVALINQRQSQRKERFDSILSSLIACSNGKETPEPTEEEFEEARQRVESRKQSRVDSRKQSSKRKN